MENSYVYIATNGQLFEARGKLDKKGYDIDMKMIRLSGERVILKFTIPSSLYSDVYILAEEFVQQFNAKKYPKLMILEQRVNDLINAEKSAGKKTL